MSKFCGNCGAQLDDDAKVCGICGAPLEDGGAAGAEIPGVEYGNDEQKAKIKKIGILAGVGAAVVVVLIIAISIISGMTGYKGLTKKVMKSIINEDAETLAETYSESILDEWEKYDTDGEKISEALIKGIYSAFDEKLDSSDYKLSYKIEDVETVRESKYEDYLSEDDIDDYKVSKIVVVEVEVTAKGSKKTKSETLKLNLVKEGGKWRLLGFDK